MDFFSGDGSWEERAEELQRDCNGNARKLKQAQTPEQEAKYDYHLARAQAVLDRHYATGSLTY